MTKPKKKTYRVVGATSYREHAPGEEFDAALTDAEERRAVERGSIKVVTKTEGKTDG